MDITQAAQSKKMSGQRSESDLLVKNIATDRSTGARRPKSHEERFRLSQTAKDRLDSLYGPILEPLAAIEQRIAAELQSPYESIGQVLRHGTQLGGKRMRPALVLLAGQSVGAIHDEHVVLATAIEMVHTATLIHDDVLDEADTRRHVPTINAKWNNHTSILLGDYLFAQSFRLAASLSSTDACRLVGEAARLVCEGEMRQVLQRDILDLDEETYIDILRGKTAELCRASCQLGAKHAGGDEKQIEALGCFGNALGIAFQIADDFLDLWGEVETVGKTLGTDIEQGKMTLPLIRLLETSSEQVKREVVEILRGPSGVRVDQIRPYVEASDARQYTEQTAKRFHQQALDALDAIEPSLSKEALIAIANFSIDRRF